MAVLNYETASKDREWKPRSIIIGAIISSACGYAARSFGDDLAIGTDVEQLSISHLFWTLSVIAAVTSVGLALYALRKGGRRVAWFLAICVLFNVLYIYRIFHFFSFLRTR